MIAVRRLLWTGLGVVPRWAASRFDPPLLVLLYHRVADLPADPQALAVSPASFRAQLELLRSRHPIIGLEEPRSLSEPTVAITFDDGYADNVTAALPILEELQVPAAFFITTGAVGRAEEFWWDELERLILTPPSVPPLFRWEDPVHGGTWRTRTATERHRLYQKMQQRMRHATPERREGWLSQLRRWTGAEIAGRPSHRPLNHQELRRLAESPRATIGAHGYSHAALAALSPEAQRQEIEGTRRTLGALIGREVTLYAYPFGAPGDVPRGAPELCRQAGYVRAFANHPGVVHGWTDGYQLPRQIVRNWSARRFGFELRRFWLS